jgi:hypothetical protein
MLNGRGLSPVFAKRDRARCLVARHLAALLGRYDGMPPGLGSQPRCRGILPTFLRSRKLSDPGSALGKMRETGHPPLG